MRGIHPAPTAKQGQYLLVNEAQLAPHPWGTPKAAAGKYQSGKNGEVILNLAGQVDLAPTPALWSTPASRDYKDSPGMATTGTNPDGSMRARLDTLPRQATVAPHPWPTVRVSSNGGNGNPQRALAGKARLEDNVYLMAWPSPHANCSTGPSHTQEGALNLQTVAAWATPNASPDAPNMSKNRGGGQLRDRLTLGSIPAQASGSTPVGFSAAMENTAGSGWKLNTRFAAWLMGFPREWNQAADRAELSTRSRKGSKGAL